MAPRRNARATKYNKLRREYDHRMRSRISRLRKQFHLLNSGNHGLSSMSEMSTLSSISSFEGDETSGSSDFSLDVSDDVWGEILGRNWRGKTMLGSDTSITSGPFTTSLSDLVPELISVGRHSSSSSGYGDDEDSDFASDMLEFSDEDGDTGLMGGSENSKEGYSGGALNPGDRWARLRRWVHQQIE